MPWKGFLAATVAVLLVVASPAAAATFTVTGTADTPPTTGCAGLECPSIRAALVSAASTDGPDTIVVRAGTHQLTNGQLVVTTPVEIVGQGARTTSVRGVPGEFRVLSVAAGVTASVTRVTLRDGQALDENGGGFLAAAIVVNRGTLTLDRVRITGGRASSGGGLANLAGTVTLTRSLVDANTATDRRRRRRRPLELQRRHDDRARLHAHRQQRQRRRRLPLVGRRRRQHGHVRTRHGRGQHGASSAGAAASRTLPADTLRMRATIVAANTNGMGASNCVGAITSEGANLEDGTDCGLTGTGDRQQTEPAAARRWPTAEATPTCSRPRAAARRSTSRATARAPTSAGSHARRARPVTPARSRRWTPRSIPDRPT